MPTPELTPRNARTQDRRVVLPCPQCGHDALPCGEPALLGGTAIVQLRRYRCLSHHSHWWDDERVLIDVR
jgi:hypothetical protein